MESVQEPGVSPSALALPLLVHDLGPSIDDSQDDDSQTQYSISSQALSTVAIDELRHYRCFETPQGWVLALDPASWQTFLWRPQDSERIQLPPKEQGFPENCKCLLSDMPGAASGCAVVVFDLDDNEMWVCKIGATDWDSHRYEPTMFVKGRIPRLTNIAMHHGIAAVAGKIYFEYTSDEMGVIDFHGEEGPKFGSIEVDMVDLPQMASMYLVESCGELFLVVIFFVGKNVHKIAKHALYKMDFSELAWCEVDEIGGDRVFLLSGDRGGISCFGASCSAGDHLRGNHIYFLNHVAIHENFLHVIDLKKGTEEEQRPFKHKGYLMPLRSPFWLLPTQCTSQAQGSYFLLCNLWRRVKRAIICSLYFKI
uniref:Uncharacterized protein n=1 Tax=Avena sativa TaxID=4498 RepID=A0ACD5ZHZ2_AVESA